MPNSKQRRKKGRAARRGSKDQSDAQPQPWFDKKLHTNFKSQPRQVEKKYWRQ